MWRLSDAELNCVSTKIRRMSACRQLLIGTSIRRYLPPIGTAGFDRVAVSGNSREPWPPPRMMASVSCVMSRITTQARNQPFLTQLFPLAADRIGGIDTSIGCHGEDTSVSAVYVARGWR